MVVGMDIFKSWFKDYQDNYIIIGGSACDAAITDAGFTPRATKDIDIILVIEALSDAFVAHLFHCVDTTLKVILQRHSHSAFNNVGIYRRMRVQEEPTIKNVASCDFRSVEQSAQFMGKHIGFD